MTTSSILAQLLLTVTMILSTGAMRSIMPAATAASSASSPFASGASRSIAFQALPRRASRFGYHQHQKWVPSTFRSSQQRTVCQMSLADTPLGGAKGSPLLDGLDVYTVPAKGDGHPLSVYGIESSEPKEDDVVLLMLHGRTWSSVPVYHLLGGPKNREKGLESRSLVETMVCSQVKPYMMDFRGFGGTPHDDTGGVEPNRCVDDVETVLQWLSERHGLKKGHMPTLLGWSQGALVAQLAAQKNKPLMSKLILYGSIYDPMVRYPREPLYVRNKANLTEVENDFDSAIEDFTVEGSIPPEPAVAFAEAALISDPIKAQWKRLYEFNNCDPGRIHVPTLVVAGDQDPYAPLHVQQELFSNIGRGSDRTWSILADADHAVHLLEGRARFAGVISSFIHNGKRSGQLQYPCITK